jgi:ABC-type transport system involved in multi-copper enzyme maturation permease subunit
MIWLTWRQLRTQALTVFAAVTMLAIYLVVLGLQIRHSYDTDIVGCTAATCDSAIRHFSTTYIFPVFGIGALLIAAPGLLGVFWGAPLIARELEEKTHRLVWNQSVTRTRWLAIKLGFVAAVAVAVAGLLSALLTWSASRYDQVKGDRFVAQVFDSRNVVPLGYAAFALVLGTVTGLLVRRAVPAMAITLAVFVAIQVLMPLGIRSHLMPPRTTTVTLDAAAMTHIGGFGFSETGGRVQDYTMPGTWPLTSEYALFNPDGAPFTITQARQCLAGERPRIDACMANQNLHFSYRYQPASRYWPFQWIELSVFLMLTALLTGFGFWWIRRRPS